MNVLTGIADEAGSAIETQIAAHKELGWNGIELRLVDGKNVAGALPQDAFESMAAKVEEAGLQVTSFGSAIGNWSRKISDDFSRDVEELKTAIPRMQRFGTKFIRTMSWVGEGVGDTEWRDEVFRRYRELAKMAEDGGIYLAHENCTGWAGQSAWHQRRFLEEIDSANLVVLYDIGNTISHGMEPWEYYEGVKDLIRYVHVKDARKNPAGGPSEDYTYPGEGDAMVREILSDLLSNGYEGTIAIEPHVAAIVHLGGGKKVSKEEMYASYVRYGRKFVELVEDVRAALK